MPPHHVLRKNRGEAGVTAPLQTGRPAKTADCISAGDTVTLQLTPLGGPELPPAQSLDGHGDRSQHSRRRLDKEMQHQGKSQRRFGAHIRRLEGQDRGVLKDPDLGRNSGQEGGCIDRSQYQPGTPQGCFNAQGAKLDSWDDLPEQMKAEIDAHYPEYRHAPPLDDDRPNETSWTYFKKVFDERDAKAEKKGGGH